MSIRSIRRVFTAVALAAAAIGTAGCAGYARFRNAVDEAHICSKIYAKTKTPCAAFAARDITQNEKRLARRFFGPSLKVDDLKIFSTPQYNPNTLGGTFGERRNRIYFYGDSMTAPDYTRARDFPRAVFMHEMVHIWQYQTGHKFDNLGAYYPAVNDSIKFAQLPTESQAEIVEIYTRLFLSRNQGGLRVTDRDYMRNVARIVEGQFPGAKRLKLSRAP